MSTSAVVKFLFGTAKPALEILAAGAVVGEFVARTELGGRAKSAVLAALELDGPPLPSGHGTPPLHPPPVGLAPAAVPALGCACQGTAHGAPVGAAPPAGAAQAGAVRFACPGCPPVVAGRSSSRTARTIRPKGLLDKRMTIK